jgi:hypothetical protein
MSVWQSGKGQAEQIAEFPETPAGLDAFSHFLGSAEKQQFLLLINRHEERYLGEKMPPLPRLERQQLAETRSRRAFPDTPWRCVSTNNGRREENTAITLMAVDNSASFEAWIHRLNKAGSALTGIYSLPQLLPQLLADAGKKPAQVIVLSKHRRRCRLTLLEHGQPRAAQWSENENAAAIDDAYRRLLAQHAANADHGSTPSLCIIGPPGWPPQQPPGDTTHLPAGEDAANTILSLADRRWPDYQFAPPSIRAIARQRRLARWCWHLGILVLITGLSISLERLLEREALQKQAEVAEKHLAQDRQALETALADIARSGMSQSQLLQLAKDHQQLRQQHASFTSDLVALSRMFDKNPEIRLELIDWQIPAQQALTSGQTQLEVIGSLLAADSEQAARLLQQFEQASDRQSRVIAHPQRTGPDEFRFSLRLTALPAT